MEPNNPNTSPNSPDNPTNKKNHKITIMIYASLFVFLALFSLLKHLIFFREQENTLTVISYAFTFVALLLLTFIYSAIGLSTRQKVIKAPGRLAVLCVCMMLAYGASLFIEQISIFLVPAFLAGALLAPLAKRKDVFLANLFCCIMVFISLLIEHIAKGSGDIFRLIIIFIAGIFGGSIASFVLTHERRRFDFFIINMHTPGRHPGELAWYLRLHGEAAPIVATAPEEENWCEEDLIDCGFTRLMTRPLDMGLLRALAREVVKGITQNAVKP